MEETESGKLKAESGNGKTETGNGRQMYWHALTSYCRGRLCYIQTLSFDDGCPTLESCFSGIKVHRHSPGYVSCVSSLTTKLGGCVIVCNSSVCYTDEKLQTEVITSVYAAQLSLT